MNDKEIWESTFKNKEDIEKFETKPGPALTKEQVEAIKENRRIEKEEQEKKKLLESLENHIKILEEELDKVKRQYSRISQVRQKPQTTVVTNENNITEKQTKQQILKTD